MKFLESGAMNQIGTKESISYKYTDLLPIIVSGLAPLSKLNLEYASFEAFLFFKTLVAVSNIEVIVFNFPNYIDWTRKW